MSSKKRRRKLQNQKQQSPQKKPQSAGTTMFRQLVISGASLLLIYFFISIPVYSDFFEDKPKKYFRQMKKTRKDLDLESRKKKRYEGNYVIYEYLSKAMDSNSIFLIPPAPYLVENSYTQNNKQTHLWAYPSLLYYHLDYIKTVDMKSPPEELAKATHSLTVNKKRQFFLYEFNTPVLRDSIINLYRQYELKTFFHAYQVENYLNEKKK